MLNLETLHFDPEEIAAVQDKQQRLQDALEHKEATPENVTRVMLDCGRLGDYETLLEQNRLVKQGSDKFLAAYQEGLGGWDTVQLEPAAQALTNQLADEARILWSDPATAQTATESDPFLTAAALNWAREEGDIQYDLPPEVLGVQSAAVSQAAKCFVEGGWDWQTFWIGLLEAVTVALLLASNIFLMVGLSAEIAVATADLLVITGFGMMFAAMVTAVARDIVEDSWDSLLDFFADVKSFWREFFHSGVEQPVVRQETAGTATLLVSETETAAQNYAYAWKF